MVLKEADKVFFNENRVSRIYLESDLVYEYIPNPITASFVPSGYTNLTNYQVASGYPITNGYSGTDDKSYARLQLTANTSGHVDYTIDTSSIPRWAVIRSITCKVRVAISSRMADATVQLYSGTTAKGSASAITSTSTSNIEQLVPGSWTRAELSDMRIHVASRGASGGGSINQRSLYFYGADISITYVA